MALGHAVDENDAVELLNAVDKVDLDGTWQAGTGGAVVSERDQWKLVEIAGERGVTPD